jgi:hypothetical protein
MATVKLLTTEQDRALARGLVAYQLNAHGDTSKALEILAADQDRGQKANGYLMVAQQLAEKKDFAGAFRVARQIDGMGQPAVLVDTLLRIATQQGKADESANASKTVDEALYIVERERESGNEPSFMLAGLYQNIASGLAALGQQARAAGVISRIRDLAAPEGDSNQAQFLPFWVSSAQAAIGDLAGALETAETMPACPDRDQALFGVASAATQLGTLYEAQDLAARITDQNLRYVALRGIADASARAGDPGATLAAIEGIQGDEQRAYAYAQLALGQAQNGDSAAAQTAELAYTAALAGGSKTEGYVFEFIAVTRGLLGDFPGALSVVNGLKDDSRMWPLWNLTAMLVAAGRKQEALELAEAQTAPLPKAYGLLGVASEMIQEAEVAEKKAAGRH